MDNTKLAVLLISAFFVISIIASGFIYMPPSIDQEPANELDELPETQLPMSVEGVEAKVVLLLPKLKLVANTQELNINNLDSSIYAMQGVQRVSSFFRINPEVDEITTGFIYVADLQLSKSADKEEIIADLFSNTSFETTDVFAFALVDLPSDIEFTNSDLELTRPYSLPRNEAEAIVSTSTLRGDELTVNIEAVFIGEQPISLVAYELENITATPLSQENTINAPVAFLEPILLLDISTYYSQLPLLPEIEGKIHAMEGVQDFNLTKPSLEAQLTLIADNNINAENAADLNLFLSGLSNDIIFYNADSFRASLLFEQGTSLQPIADSIEEKLGQLSLDTVIIREQLGHAIAEIPLESGNVNFAMLAIPSLLKSKGLEFSLYQPGEISLTEITSEETEQTYAIDANVVSSFFSKQHSINEEVEVVVTYSIVREEIAAITAIEE